MIPSLEAPTRIITGDDVIPRAPRHSRVGTREVFFFLDYNGAYATHGGVVADRRVVVAVGPLCEFR